MLVAKWHLLNAEDERNESRDDESESLNNYHFNQLQFMSPADEFLFSFVSASSTGLYRTIQPAAGVEEALQDDSQLHEDRSQAEEPGDLRSGEND